MTIHSANDIIYSICRDSKYKILERGDIMALVAGVIAVVTIAVVVVVAAVSAIVAGVKDSLKDE